MVSLLYAVEGPHEGLPLALELNREDGIIRTLPGGCQSVMGQADRVDGWWMDDARLPCSAFPQWTSAVCVEKLCGVSLRLHLNPSSLQLKPCLAEQTSSSVCLACINFPCLAHCLLLITLINFNSPGSHRHSSCFFCTGTHNYTDTFPHAIFDRHECILVWMQPCICFTMWDSQH